MNEELENHSKDFTQNLDNSDNSDNGGWSGWSEYDWNDGQTTNSNGQTTNSNEYGQTNGYTQYMNEDPDGYNSSYDSNYLYGSSSESYSGSPVLGTGYDSQVPKLIDEPDYYGSDNIEPDYEPDNIEPNYEPNYEPDPTTRLYPNKLLVIIIIGILFGMALVSHSVNLTPIEHNDSYILVESGYPTPTYELVVKLPSWWDQYNNRCCVDKGVGGIFGRSDCTADGSCQDYLNSWLRGYKQSFHNSSLVGRCCYEFKIFGYKNYSTFCSYTCLNTIKNKWDGLIG